MTQGQAETSTSNVIASQISTAYTSTYTLIDSGASYSFVFASFIKKLDMVPELPDDVCSISLSSREKLTSRFIFKVVPIKIVGRELPIDLIFLETVDYDVIFGMDWLSKPNAIIFCKKKKVVFQPSEEETFQYKGTPRGSKWSMILEMKTSRMLTKGYVEYLASIVDTMKKVKTELSDVHVATNFRMCFQKICQDYHQIEKLSSR